MNSFSDVMRFVAVLALAVNAQAAGISGKIAVPRAPNNGDVVVYIDKIPGKTFPTARNPETMDQLNLKFTPHLLTILVGTRVAFPNSDVVRHNVFSPGPTQKLQLGTYPVKETKYQVFNKAGVVTLLCNIHAEMSAYIVVTDTPYSAITDDAGNYTIADVPPGRYLLRVWHEKFEKTPPVEITVTEENLKGINPVLKK